MSLKKEKRKMMKEATKQPLCSASGSHPRQQSTLQPHPFSSLGPADLHNSFSQPQNGRLHKRYFCSNTIRLHNKRHTLSSACNSSHFFLSVLSFSPLLAGKIKRNGKAKASLSLRVRHHMRKNFEGPFVAPGSVSQNLLLAVSSP